MAGTTARFWGPSDEGPKWRSKQSWRGLQQDFEIQARKKNREFERHRSLADRYRCRRWREKTPDPDGLPRLRARTPCCKQLFGEWRSVSWVCSHRVQFWTIFANSEREQMFMNMWAMFTASSVHEDSLRDGHSLIVAKQRQMDDPEEWIQLAAQRVTRSFFCEMLLSAHRAPFMLRESKPRSGD